MTNEEAFKIGYDCGQVDRDKGEDEPDAAWKEFLIKPIHTEADYRAALVRIDELMDAKLGSPEGEELDVLTDLVEHYESKQEPME